LSALIIEGKAEFELEVSENKVVIFSPHFNVRPEIYPWTPSPPKGGVDPRLRTCVLVRSGWYKRTDGRTSTKQHRGAFSGFV